jgi:hypothetical protein
VGAASPRGDPTVTSGSTLGDGCRSRPRSGRAAYACPSSTPSSRSSRASALCGAGCEVRVWSSPAPSTGSSVDVSAGARVPLRPGGDDSGRPDRTPRLRAFERSFMRAGAAPAASQLVAVQIREDVAPLADTPALDELRDELSPEGRSVSLELVVPGHAPNGTARSGSVQAGKWCRDWRHRAAGASRAAFAVAPGNQGTPRRRRRSSSRAHARRSRAAPRAPPRRARPC